MVADYGDDKGEEDGKLQPFTSRRQSLGNIGGKHPLQPLLVGIYGGLDHERGSYLMVTPPCG